MLFSKKSGKNLESLLNINVFIFIVAISARVESEPFPSFELWFFKIYLNIDEPFNIFKYPQMTTNPIKSSL